MHKLNIADTGFSGESDVYRTENTVYMYIYIYKVKYFDNEWFYVEALH